MDQVVLCNPNPCYRNKHTQTHNGNRL